MGLPSKKQLHKHKRGARKALDTLDAMDKPDESTISEPEVEKLIKKNKTTPSKTKVKRGKKNKQPAHSAIVETPASPISLSLDEPFPIEAESVQDSKGFGLTGDEESEISEFQSVEKEESVEPEISQTIETSEALPEIELSQSEKPRMDKTTKMIDETLHSASKEETAKMSRKEQNRNSFESEDYEGLAEDTQKDKYLSFRIGDETYGVSIEYVTEIIVIQKITEVPDTPPFVKGVINLRGKVIPVIDIRHRFGMKSRDYDERTCIIVVDYTETAVGMIVDTVNEVVDIPESQVDQTPRTHSGTESTYIQGMGKIGKKVMIILNLEKVLFAEELLKRQKALQD